jgi:hypothetical protein
MKDTIREDAARPTITVDPDMLYMIGTLIIELGNYEQAKEVIIRQTSGDDIADSLPETCACPWHMFGDRVTTFLANAALEISGVTEIKDIDPEVASNLLSDDFKSYLIKRAYTQREAMEAHRLNTLPDDAVAN